MKSKWFAPFAWGVLGWIIIVILWGAYVRATGSGAGCGRHWPLCNGEVIPLSPDFAGTIEFTHRALSGLAILLVGGMIYWGFRVSAPSHPVRKSLVAAGILIVVESLLGAGLVLFELVADNDSTFRALAVALHLANTFLLVASLALSAYWASGGRPLPPLKVRATTIALGSGLIGMVLIGMSGAITALGDTLFPARSLAEGLAQDLDPNAHFLIELRVIHPVLAVAVALYSLALVRALLLRNSGLAKRMLLALLAVGTIQLGVGLVNLLLLAPIPLQIIHLLTAEIVWIVYVLTTTAILAETPG